MNEERFILEEVLEHTIDCDYNRKQHFSQYNKYKKKAGGWGKARLALLICTTGVYVLYFSGMFPDYNPIMKVLVLILSIVSIGVSMFCMYFNYDSLANAQWNAAHNYQSLYRRAQFFHNDFLDDINIAKIHTGQIRNELTLLNRTSPHIESFENFLELENKEYPVQKLIENKTKINIIKNCINSILNNTIFDLYYYGSDRERNSDSDYDLALIIYNSELLDDIKLKVLAIRKSLYDCNIIADIFVVHYNDFYNKYEPFYANILDGKLLYSNSSNIDKNFGEKDLNHFKVLIEYFIKNTEEALNSSNKRLFFINVYYSYYHLMAYGLANSGILWNGESNICYLFYKHCISNNHNISDECMSLILKSQDLKNAALYNYTLNVEDEEVSAYLPNILYLKNRLTM